MDYLSIYDFWFKELRPEQRFVKDSELDRNIRQRFSDLHHTAAAGELYEWRETPEGRLCEIIVLDQFSRNMFRNQPKSFSCDSMALALAQEAISRNQDVSMEAIEKQFLYMPFMHSESLKIHDQALQLFQAPGLEDAFEYEIKHRDIIVRFGRYPHRNAILGRESTAEELEFLKGPNSSF